MDHRLITIGEAVVLLDRLEQDETPSGWQVITTTFVDINHKYDEWINFPDPHQARAFIKDFTEELATHFIDRAKAWWDIEHVRQSMFTKMAQLPDA